MKKASVFLLMLSFLAACKVSSKAEYLQSAEFAKLNRPYSQAVKYDNILYVSGQIGVSSETGKLVEGGIIPETQESMKNIKDILEAHGSSLDKVIKCTCIVADVEDFGAMSAEYLKFFPKNKPARTSFADTKLPGGVKVEIECMAYVN